jgi:hypothetical protein
VPLGAVKQARRLSHLSKRRQRAPSFRPIRSGWSRSIAEDVRQLPASSGPARLAAYDISSANRRMRQATIAVDHAALDLL